MSTYLYKGTIDRIYSDMSVAPLAINPTTESAETYEEYVKADSKEKALQLMSRRIGKRYGVKTSNLILNPNNIHLVKY